MCKVLLQYVEKAYMKALTGELKLLCTPARLASALLSTSCPAKVQHNTFCSVLSLFT